MKVRNQGWNSEKPHPQNCPLFRISLECVWIRRVDLNHGKRLVKLHTSYMYISGEGHQVHKTKTKTSCELFVEYLKVAPILQK